MGSLSVMPAGRTGPALFALASSGFTIGTTEFATMSVLPLVSHSLATDLPRAGEAISAYALGVVFSAALLAAAGDVPIDG